MMSWLSIQLSKLTIYLAYKRTQISMIPNDWTRKKSFCPAPWIHANLDASGGRRLCCMASAPPEKYRTLEIKDFWNSEYMKDVRTKMMSGTLPKDCFNCKVPNKFDSYQKGLRITFNHHRSSILKSTQSNGVSTHPLVFLDYRNIKCNFMCKFCGPESSSRWQDLFKKTPQFNEISPGHVNLAKYDSQKKINLYSLEFQKLTQYNPIEKIYFAGGEPLLASEHFPVLDILIQNRRSRQVYLSYNTNLSHSSALMQTWLEKLTHFKKVDIYCSIDGHEELTNYIRKGMVFSTFIKNIKLLKEFKEKHNGFFFNLDITMTSVFLLNLKDFSELVIQLQVPVDAKVMLGYEYKSLFLRCEFLPQELRKQLVTDWLKYFVQLSSANQYLLEKLRQNLILAQNLEEFSSDVQIKALKQARTHDRLFPEDSSFSSFFDHHEPAAKWLHSLPSESC